MTDKLSDLFTLQSELDNRIISERNIEKSLDKWVWVSRFQWKVKSMKSDAK
ncbi:TPA: hypothetical protein ACQUHH_003058 [Bacillus mobilis]